MTLITGTFLDSGRQPIASGVLRVQLDAPLIDESPTPDAYALTVPRDFDITNGALAPCDLQESETAGISYTFAILQRLQDFDYYLAGTGEFYARNTDRPTHLHTDGKYYSGVTQSAESIPLERVTRERLDLIGGAFQAIVPNQAAIDFAQIARTGFATDRLPQAARQIAEALRRDVQFMQSLINLLVTQPYSPTQTYLRGNIVESGGSGYQCLLDNTVGIAPNTGPPHWRLLVAKGDAGGTGGQDTAYNAGTWDGQLWAPSANAIRDIIETLARTSQLATYAPLTSPAFTGTPTRTANPLAGDRSTQLATTQWIGNEFAPIASPALTGAPSAPTPALASNSDSIATTRWVRDWVATQQQILVIASASSSQTLTVNAFAGVSFDTEHWDLGNRFAVNSFTPNVTGWYRVSVSLGIQGNGTTLTGAIGLTIDNSEFLRVVELTLSGTLATLNGTSIIRLTAGQILRFICFVAGSGVTTASTRAAAGAVVFNRLMIESLGVS